MRRKKRDIIRVFLCDNHTIFRQGVRKLLELEKDINVVGEANNGKEMLAMLKEASPDVILMELKMPEIDGVASTCKVKKMWPRIHVVILTAHEDDAYIFKAIKAGVMGYLLKNSSISEVINAIHRVCNDEALVQPLIAAKVLKEFASLHKRRAEDENSLCNDLTVREKEVLRLIVLGGTNRAIANKLGVAEKTVKNHISNIFQVLHVKNRTEAAIYALRKRL
jgi:DNA-binding NarL/FixJ family response regulator